MEYFTQQLINGLTLGSIYGLIAIGYTMVYGIIGMINFAHGEIYMISAFCAIIAIVILGPLVGSLPVMLIIVLLVSMIFTAAYGWTLERVAYRPLRGSFRLAPLISAIGMSIALQNYVQISQGARIKPIQPLIHGSYEVMEKDGFAVQVSNI
ncbi:MAG: branched-chain amino acid ABC transporter permease LivH, partial [Alphaproteobacteria bacterium]|nr:branched-chain amino acid ABC transporter permease LivH [Alphaproteobacteria bacterium]